MRARVAPKGLRWICNTNDSKDEKNAADLIDREGRLYVCTATNAVGNKVTNREVRTALEERIAISNNQLTLAAQMREERKNNKLQYVMQFSVKIGSYVEITCNIDVSDGLFNGAPGVVARVDVRPPDSAGVERPYIIWVLFDNPDVGRQMRRNCSHLMNIEGVDPAWTPVQPKQSIFTVQLPLYGNHRFRCLRTQFPIVAAHARTIHHVLGATLGDIGICFKGGFTENGLVYTATSRPRLGDELHLERFDLSMIQTSAKVVAEMARLREPENQVQLCVLPVEMLVCGRPAVTFATHNVRNLPRSEADVAASVVSHCDISCLQETHLGPAHGPEVGLLPTHWMIRNDSIMQRQGSGSAPIRGSLVHVHKRFGPLLRSHMLSQGHYELTAAMVATPHMSRTSTLTIGIYVTTSPFNMRVVVEGLTAMKQHFEDLITPATLITILGDFNCDDKRAHFEYYPELLAYMTSIGLHHASKHIRGTHTRDGGLDQIWTNAPAEQCVVQVCPTYFSDHLPLVLVVHDDPTPRVIDHR